FDHLSDFLGQGPSEDENNIVNHMFGRNTDMVKETLAQKTGVSSGQIAGILAILAPIVMGYLGKQKQSTGGGLGDILGGLVGGSSSKSQGVDMGSIGNLAGEFFNQNNDTTQKGGILDALAGMFEK